MARYRQVSSEVAGDVESGALSPGDELPSIREAARRYNTTGSTISRAYRHLADAGVIEGGDRRRSRVAAGGAVAARRMRGGSPRCGSPAATTPASTPCCAKPGQPRSRSAPGAASTA